MTPAQMRALVDEHFELTDDGSVPPEREMGTFADLQAIAAMGSRP